MFKNISCNLSQLFFLKAFQVIFLQQTRLDLIFFFHFSGSDLFCQELHSGRTAIYNGMISFYSLISQSCPRTMNHKIILTNSNICIMPIPSQPRQQLLPLTQQMLQQQHQQQQQQEHRQQQRQLLRRLQFDFFTKSILLIKYLFKVFEY